LIPLFSNARNKIVPMTNLPFKETQYTVYEILDQIRRKPGFYIVDPELTRLDSFMAGYDCGLAQGGMTFRQEEPDFHRFYDWVAHRLGYSSSTSGWYKMIRGRCASEREAYDKFFELLDEFRASGGGAVV